MLRPNDVTACLVTRGDVDMQPILDSLIFENVIIWNNAERPDKKCAGRYFAALEAETPIVYFQDDDVVVPPATQKALLVAYEPGVMVANWGHGLDADGYDDLPLVGAGAIVDRELPWQALALYLRVFPEDEAFYYEADFVAGALYPVFRHLWLAFDIRDVCYSGRRLADEPWQRDLKFDITQRARAIRDGMALVA